MRLATLIISSLFLIYCYAGADPKAYACKTSSECIPNPSQCHPKTCINKAFASNFTMPNGTTCDTAIDCSAAYLPSDCKCDKSVCKDRNLYNNGACDDDEDDEEYGMLEVSMIGMGVFGIAFAIILIVLFIRNRSRHTHKFEMVHDDQL
eukprot:TRINITY_DN2356_c0_g1_i1.p1 TRINITY_DN2356_c0_g1~~TRINITY_DN2356_c0_g1_i1.p1  ORF type:complete len:163 (-),score=30.50 TRINITY_DN2356_c0_g1_i1:72-518(-)